MDLLSGHEPISREVQAPENRPHILMPQPWLAKATLFLETWTRNHRSNLEKLGFRFDKLPFWKKYQLQPDEIKHGLPTYKAGEWKNTFLFNAHNDGEAQLAQSRFASGMMWEMTKDLVGERAALCIGLKMKISEKGELVQCEPKIDKREWPMTVRVLKRGIDGKPVSFVDIIIERQDYNPFVNIDWKRITENDEIYTKQLSEKCKVSQTRSLDDWYVEGVRKDKYGEFLRPDILVGANRDDFRLDQMSSDRRPLLTIGLEQSIGSVSGVTVGVQTHLPFNGMDMMGMVKDEQKPYSRDAAFEAVVKDPKLIELIDASEDGKAKLAKYRKDWEMKRPKVTGLNSFLATRFARKDQSQADERTQIESLLTLTSFEESVMAEFCRLTDAQKVIDNLVIPHDLNKWLIELPKKIKEVSGEKVAGIMFLSLAMYLTDHEAQGFAVGPEAMQAIMGELGYASVGSGVLNKIEVAGKLVSNEEKIKKTNTHANKLRAVVMINDYLGREKDPDKLVGLIEKLANEDIENGDETQSLTRRYAKEILGQYMGEISSAESTVKDALDPDDSVKHLGGLLTQLDSQTSYFESLSIMRPFQTPDMDAFVDASGNLLNLSDEEFGFNLTRDQMVRVIEQVSRDHCKGELRVVDDGVDWGSSDPVVLYDRINKLHRVMADQTIGKYHREGIRWLLSKKEAEVKTADDMEVERLTNELTRQVGFLTSVAKEISGNMENAVSSMPVRLGFMKALEGLGLYGAAGLVADSRPQQNASKIVVKAPDGFELIFETALDANHTTVGVGQINETISRKEVADNPRAMMEKVLPYLRANPELGRELRRYLEREKVGERDINLINEMLNSEEYACFADINRISDGREADTIDLWGEGYLSRKNRGARNARYRKYQQAQARVLMKHFNGMLGKVVNGTYMVSADNQVELKWFMQGGFNSLWSETNRYKLEQTKTNLAQIALIFGLYIKSKSSSEDNERMLLSIRGIQEREIERQRGLRAKLRQVYRRERGEAT